MTKPLFADVLHAARTEAGLSLETLANMVGIAHEAVRNYEIGKHIPRVDTALAMAELLGLNLAEMDYRRLTSVEQNERFERDRMERFRKRQQKLWGR